MTIQVFIQTSRTTVIDLIDFDITVKELSLKYLFKTRCKEGYPNLRYRGYSLEQGKALNYYGIERESNILFNNYATQPLWLKRAEIDSEFLCEEEFIAEYMSLPSTEEETFNPSQVENINKYKHYLTNFNQTNMTTTNIRTFLRILLCCIKYPILVSAEQTFHEWIEDIHTIEQPKLMEALSVADEYVFNVTDNDDNDYMDMYEYNVELNYNKTKATVKVVAEDERECPICLDPIKSKAIVTECNHTFCEDCFKKTSQYCSLCRKDLA